MKTPTLLTCFIKETRWVPTRREDALRILSEEMDGADPEGLLAYVLEATKTGKTVTVGECRFRQDVTGGELSPSS